MTSSILSTLLSSFYNCYRRNIILDTLSNISLLDKYYKKLNSLYNLPFYTHFILSLTTFWIHIVLYDNIRYVSTCTFRNLLYFFFASED